MTIRLLGIPDELRLEIEQNSPGVTTEAARLIIENAVQQASAAAEEITAEYVKEVQSIVGPHGSLSRIQVGGIKVTPGLGIGVYADGVFKTNIQPNGTLVIGSNIERPETTTELFFVEDTVYNNEEFGAGDFLIGNNNTGESNITWDASEGTFSFRLGTTVTAYMDTDGTLNFLSGTIGGWQIDTTRIQKFSGAVGIALDSDVPQIRVGNTDGIYIVINGDLATAGILSSNFVTGQSGFYINANTADAEFNNITARGELKTFLLSASNQMVVAGNETITKDGGKLGADVTSGATTVDFGKALTVGNWIKIQGPDSTGTNSLEWMLIGSLVSGTTYNVTRNVDGSGANGWLKDTPFAVIGASGDSRIELVAGASASIQLITQGATWNTQTVQASMSTVAGAITAGAGATLLDSSGIKIIATGLLAENNGYKFVDTADTTKLLGGLYAIARHSPNNDAYVELRAAPQDGSLATVYGSVDSVASTTAIARLTADSSLNAGAAAAFNVEQTATGRIYLTNIDTLDFQAAAVFNEAGADLDFRIESDAHASAFKLDAGGEFIQFFGGDLATFDNGTEHRLEIGQDHYFPTRNSSDKTVYINEANQDIDFDVQTQNQSRALFIDAGLDTAVSFIWDGWAQRDETWTRTGNHTFTVSGDLTATFRKGTKIRYKDGGAYEYGVVGSSTVAAGTTTVNLIVNTDYAMAAATITDTYISYINNPEGFPEWFTYAPTLSCSGAMTWTTTTNIYTKWRPAGGQEIEVAIFLIGTTGGTASNTVYSTVPIAIASVMTSGKIGVTQINDGGARTTVGSGYVDTTNGIQMYKANDANFALATGRVVIFDGSYPY